MLEKHLAPAFKRARDEKTCERRLQWLFRKLLFHKPPLGGVEISAETEWPILLQHGRYAPHYSGFARRHANAMQIVSFCMVGLAMFELCLKILHFLTRPKRFELLTPRFVV